VAERLFESELLDLGRRIDYPPTPDLPNAVRRRLIEQRAPTPTRWRARLWALAAAAVAILIIAAGVVTVGPDTRSALAERLGLRGVQITQPQQLPSGQAAGRRLNLGQPLTSVADARSRVAFRVPLPSTLGEPDEVYLLDSPPGGQVALLYAEREGIPRTSSTGVGLLLTEFQASFPDGGPILKGVPPGSRLEEVTVNGARAYWIEGDPHTFFFQDAQGRIQAETTRLAANVLLWEDGPVTLRLESALNKDAALAIATSTH
jgi:hypothetical protein